MEDFLDAEKELRVHMLGYFAVSYDSKKLSFGRNNMEKSVQLLQIVWLSGKKGVSKEYLLNALYYKDSFTDRINSLNNLIYRIRQKMKKLGFPDTDLIVFQNGNYYWSGRVPLYVDALEFESLVKKAEGCEGDEQLEYCRKALRLYTGELLPMSSAETWVLIEAQKYKNLFEKAFHFTEKYLINHKKYHELLRLSQRAAELYPFDGWQIPQIESLVKMSRYKEAGELYDKTVKQYFQELGTAIPEGLLKYRKIISEQIAGDGVSLYELLGQLKEKETRNRQGGYWCSYLSFVDCYRILSRIGGENERKSWLMMCHVVDYRGRVIQNQEKVKQSALSMREAIRTSLKSRDVFTSSGQCRFLILFYDTSREDCVKTYKRICQNYRLAEGTGTRIKYCMVTIGGGHEKS